MTRKEKIYELAKGFKRKATGLRVCRPRVEKGLLHAFIARKVRKRDNRSLWIQNINAFTMQFGIK
jgi:large subunit ribosomal protein L20